MQGNEELEALRQAGRQAACPASSLQAHFRKLTDTLA